MTCRGICKQHKVSGPANSSARKYSAGQRRCSKCEIFMRWEGAWCPCCGCRLRSKPRNTADRRRTTKDWSDTPNWPKLLVLYR
ncbi:MAG: hypothetical protein M3258_02115 [Thermoproteota archaeon]|nr:hypothetical protein [Thermoproteota archaeon]